MIVGRCSVSARYLASLSRCFVSARVASPMSRVITTAPVGSPAASGIGRDGERDGELAAVLAQVGGAGEVVALADLRGDGRAHRLVALAPGASSETGWPTASAAS